MNRAQKLIKILEDLIKAPEYPSINAHRKELEPEGTAVYNKVSDNGADGHGYHIKGYNTDSSFANDSLRSGKSTLGRAATHIDYLSELTKHPTQHTFHSYRGSTGVDYSNLKKDEIVHDKGFTSTSLNAYVANKFSHDKEDDDDKEHPHLFRIHVTPGTKGHYISAHDDSLNLDNKGEHEFLLHKGTHFRVGDEHEIALHGVTHKITDLHIHHQDD